MSATSTAQPHQNLLRERGVDHTGADHSGAAHKGAAQHGTGRRPALDGIRALAVVAVLVYHFGGGAQSWLPGGFLGVDIFFVLSGYLITGLLLSEYARTQRIGLAAFWVARARRLLPALVVVLLAVIAWGWWTAPPESYPTRRIDLFWTVGYLANWHLIGSGDDYFAAFSAASPLRHTWSLAVEEQFYLVWPLLVAGLLWAGRRLGRALVPLMVFTAAGGLLSVWVMASSYQASAPSAAYYNTFGRVQELFAGVLLALAFAHVRTHGRPAWLPVVTRRAVTSLALAAAVLLVLALCMMRDTWPMYYRGGALWVSLLTAVLIGGVEARPGSGLARWLSWRPAVALGRISYGVYLWHWPIMLAIPVASGAPAIQEAWQQSQRVLLTLLLATLSFWLVERPILADRRWLRRPPVVLAAALAAMAAVAGTGIAATALPGTMSEQLRISADRGCPGEQIDRLTTCVGPAGASGQSNQRVTPPSVALLGDSTGRGLGSGLDVWAQQTGNTWVEAAWKRCTATGLLVVRDPDAGPDVPATACHEQAPGQIRDVLATYRPKTVIIAEFWPSSLPIRSGGRYLEPGTPEHSAVLANGYRTLVDQITSYGGRAVFVELAPPGESIGVDVAAGRPAATSRMAVLGNGEFVGSYNAVLRSVVDSRPDGAELVSLTDVICPGGRCRPIENGQIIRVDGVHYSKAFAISLTQILLQRAGVS